jgi:hypothetical protein
MQRIANVKVELMARKKVTLASVKCIETAAPTAERVMRSLAAGGDVINTKSRHAITSSLSYTISVGA